MRFFEWTRYFNVVSMTISRKIGNKRIGVRQASRLVFAERDLLLSLQSNCEIYTFHLLVNNSYMYVNICEHACVITDVWNIKEMNSRLREKKKISRPLHATCTWKYTKSNVHSNVPKDGKREFIIYTQTSSAGS